MAVEAAHPEEEAMPKYMLSVLNDRLPRTSRRSRRRSRSSPAPTSTL